MYEYRNTYRNTYRNLNRCNEKECEAGAKKLKESAHREASERVLQQKVAQNVLAVLGYLQLLWLAGDRGKRTCMNNEYTRV